NGVMCDIGYGDRVIALRADLDALPLPDTKNVPYRSTMDNVCHACGHDVHSTVLLGTGLALAQLAKRDELPGRVRLLFQPAEVPALITQLIHDVVAGTGAEVDVTYTRGVPPVVNDRLATAIVAGAAGAALGPDRVVEAEISMGGEDFSFYLDQVPGAMIRLGVGIP